MIVFFTRNEILGVTPRNLPDDHRVVVTNKGATQKISVNESDETVSKLPSSGVFLIDALTNPQGKIIVEDETVYWVGDTNTNTSGLTTSEGRLQSGFGAGNWNVDVALGKAFVFLGVVNARSKIHNFERNGKTTRVECDFWFFGCDKKTVLADYMSMDAYWLVNSDYHECLDTNGDDLCDTSMPIGFGSSVESNDDDLLKQTYYSIPANSNINEQCSKNQVCDGGDSDQEKYYTRSDGEWNWAATICGPS
jgi:hypothetical protein